MRGCVLFRCFRLCYDNRTLLTARERVVVAIIGKTLTAIPSMRILQWWVGVVGGVVWRQVKVVVHGGEIPALLLPLLLVIRQEAWLLGCRDGHIALRKIESKICLLR